MQVATLFRESATLLGASMETGGVGATGGLSDGPGSITNPGPGLVLGLDHFNHPNSNKFKLNMKLEPHDDGYETSADLMLTNATNHNDSIKCESMEDPYSFIDEDPMPDMPPGQGISHCVPSINVPHPHVTLPAPKKRGRKKKIKPEPGLEYDLGMNGNGVPTPPKIKERKKHDRFNGMPEEEVSKRTLPDHLATNLDIIIIGINPGLFAAYKGHHYAGPGNHFWKCLYLSGLTPEQMTADEDYKLLQVGIGFTNMVQRPTKGSADLTRKEIKEGCQILLEKLQRFKPKIAVFNGKLIYEVFSGKKDFSFGRQPDLVDGTNTYMWVMPSSSARCAQLPRAADKVPFYAALKKFRDYLNGIVTNIDDSEVVFSDSRLKGCCESESKADSLYSMDLMDISNAIVKREGDMIPCKKKRGRPKKIKTEGEEVKPVVRKVAQSQNVNNCDFPKKKRGRPKKNKCEDIEVSMHERNTRTPITKCFSTPSPIHSPNFCHINPPMASSNSSSSGMYNNNNNGGSAMPLTPVHQQPYSQSPRPHSQPFTHSDLSSEISAAISSDHLGSPAPTSPSLGPPDFDPPTSMPTEDTTTECRFSSPTPSTASEQQNQSVATPYSTNYHTFGIDNERFGQSSVNVNNSMQVRPSSVSDYKVQDMSSKSLSGLESLVDQIPSIADGETGVHNGSNPGMHMPDANDQYSSVYSGYVGISAPVPGTPTRSGLTNSPGPVSSPGPQNYNYNSYGSLSVASLTGGSGSNSFNNYGHHTPPSPTNSYHPMMGQSHSFMEHHGCPMPLSPYTQLPPPYGHQQFANSYPPAPPGIHMPSPNYPPGPAGPPPPYYNTSYPQTQAGSPHYHMFDRIKPDIGYGSF